jgi:hypothetical protein
LAALEALAAARLASLAACFIRFISQTTSSTDGIKLAFFFRNTMIVLILAALYAPVV